MNKVPLTTELCGRGGNSRRVKQLDPTEIYTNERGGPVHVWNHCLTFEPLDDHGPHRWRTLAQILP
jgi:hypothetical protein